MLRFLFTFLFLLSFGCGGQFIEHKPVTASKVREVNWRKYTSTALVISRATKKPVFLYFSDGCAGCKLMEKETFSDPEVAYFINQNFVPITISDNKDVLNKYGIDRFPTFVILSSKGRVVSKIVHVFESDDLIAYLKLVRRINSLTEQMDVLDLLNLGDLDLGPL